MVESRVDAETPGNSDENSNYLSLENVMAVFEAFGIPLNIVRSKPNIVVCLHDHDYFH